MKTIAIFGYGSICDISTLRTNDRITRPIKKTTKLAILYGYKLCLNKKSSKNNIAYANIIQTGNDSDCVYGIIVYLTKDEIKRLDFREGHPTHYIRSKISVYSGTTKIQVQTYISTPEHTSDCDLKISKAYCGYLCKGLLFMKSLNKTNKQLDDYCILKEKYYLEAKVDFSEQ
jgi:hypothetical protein